VAVIISGALAGLGGVFLAIGTHFYLAGQTGGRGYIGLAAMIFGNWRPGGLAMGAGLFGYADSLQLRNGGPSVHALLLLLAVLLVAMAAWRFYRGARLPAVISLAFAVLLIVWYVTTDTVADEVVQATPYVATLLVMGLSAQRLRMPKADGLPYRKGQGS
jgi:simple sugar transport system permease protein